jgi:hypothetical protein
MCYVSVHEVEGGAKTRRLLAGEVLIERSMVDQFQLMRSCFSKLEMMEEFMIKIRRHDRLLVCSQACEVKGFTCPVIKISSELHCMSRYALPTTGRE